jgi:TM2 domain-containing membrane protein YozV
MDQQKIDMFIMMNSKNFNAEQMPYIRKLMEDASEDKVMMLQMTSFKDPNTMLIISVLAGNLGIDRFMLGETGLGIAKLLTCGGLGIWTIVDWFTIMQRTRDLNFTKLQMALLG